MSTPGGSGGTDKSAKEVLDEFGQQVHEIVKNGEAKNYIGDLKGKLQEAKGMGERVSSIETCDLVEQYRNNTDAGGERYPCRKDANGNDVERFSNTLGGQCTDHRIKGNERNKTGGACAPLRRLHVCDRNLEKMDANNYDSGKATHTLLAEVCLAAKYEGQSLMEKYPHNEHHNKEGICIALARSFADIGDIIRGRDLYLGYDDKEKDQREKLENKLKDIFKQIHGGLTNSALQARYKDTTNFYELREDWWEANRETVWKAMTCNASGNTYFRKTCNDNGTFSQANDKCRCPNGNNQVPTYFDYVPQFLRWFEEWAEDFCRKRKKKLTDAITNCRNDEEQRYCSGNGFDCTKTVRGDEHFVEGDCRDCSVACSPFVKWLDNQKLEFLKQKRKYTSEMGKALNPNEAARDNKRRKRSARVENHEGYHKEFYDILKTDGYKDGRMFFALLGKEGLCKEQPKVKGETADSIDFKNENTGKTFSRTEICEPCPWCGLKSENPPWKVKGDDECAKGIKKEYKKDNITDIPVLTPEKLKKGILKKYSKFCKNGANGEKSVIDGGQIEKWECYYDESKESGQNNNCILGKWESFTGKETVKSYNAFFWKWVHDMLIDSIEWRNEHGNCINKKQQSKCIPACKKTCDCFKKWIEQKEKEWKNIKIHFKKQKDIKPGTHDIILNYLLKKKELLQIIQETYGNADETEHIKQLLDEEEAAGVTDNENKTTIDKLLKHEEDDANSCLNTHKENCQQQENLARSLPPAGGAVPSPDPLTPRVDQEEEEEDDDEDDEEGEESEAKEEVKTTETTAEDTEGEVTKETTTTPLDVCSIVAELFKNPEQFKEVACQQKYGLPQRHWGWKCIPSDTKSVATSENGAPRRARSAGVPDGVTTTSSGSICVPPRRRRLYIHKVENDGITDDKSLRKWFIETAAIETFFLWHRYKEEKKPPAQEGALGLASTLDGSSGGGEGDDPKPEDELKSGKIPDGFLRQMFYTFGDYRDILMGNTDMVGDTIISNTEGETPKTISDKIKEMLGKKSATRGSHSGTTPSSWWENNGKYIWHGMIYALTYNTDSGAKDQPPTQIDDTGKLLDKLKKENGTEGKYHYENVKLENSGTEAISNDDTIQPPTLKEFISRPPYFRYLEEWGETFCRQRTRMLKDVKDNCMRDGTKKQYSGDGEDCNEIHNEDPTIFKDLENASCANSCRLYKKWIDRKKDEFDEQKKEYSEQKDKAKNNNGFYERLTKYTEAKDFLQKLGPCSKKDSESGQDEIKFDDEGKTFGHETYCDPCSQFRVKCENGKCKNGGGGTNDMCNGSNGTRTITAKDIGNGGNSTHKLDMLVSDKSGNGFQNGLSDCMEADIFKGIRKDQWKCRNVCGYVVCKSEQGNGKENQNKIITIRALLHRWLEYFLEDYNKIRKKLKPCMYDGEGSKCENKCEQKCKCVGQWVEKKKLEWKEIKDRLLEQYKNNTDSPINFNVKSSLEKFKDRPEFKNAIKPCDDLNAFEDSSHCNGNASAGKEKDAKKDVVVCLLDKLEKEAKKCKEKHQASGTDCHPSTPVEDDEEPLEEENPVDPPKICPKPKETKEKEDEKCGEPEPPPKERAPPSEETNQNPEEKPKDEGPPAPAPGPPPAAPPSTPAAPKQRPRPQPQPKPTPPYLSPPLKTALVTSTLAWSVGIGFAAFTYFYLKVLYIYIYIYIYIYMDVFFCVDICVLIYIYVYISICIYMFVCICVCVYVCVRMFGYIFVYMYVFYIYILYICIYIDKEKNEKNEKKKNEI